MKTYKFLALSFGLCLLAIPAQAQEKNQSPKTTTASVSTMEKQCEETGHHESHHWQLYHEPSLGWLYTGLSMRGSMANNKTNTGKVGFEVGLNLPVWHGIDIGYHGGSYFKSHGTVHQAVEFRVYLNQINEGLYLGAGRQWDPDHENYGTIGLAFDPFYIELDGVKSDTRPYVAVGEFGLRWRFL